MQLVHCVISNRRLMLQKLVAKKNKISPSKTNLLFFINVVLDISRFLTS